jgi:eukaryotic-like serine/threonine-protein kinase
MGLTAGTKLGPYEIQSPLGAGGMGEVYRARDTRLERTVAIKILPPHLSDDPILRQRFEREAKAISSLNHPHICVLHDVGCQDGTDYLVMEFVEGETLTKRLAKGPLPLDQVLTFGAQIADALDRAHQSGIIHRDLKPGNIMLTSTGAKLLDFGLAKPATPLANLATLSGEPTQSAPVTQHGMIVGTFQYMSPEQIEGKELDGRTDIFSFGAVLYEMLTGQRAFQGKSQLSLVSAILEKEPAPISKIKPMTPPALDHAIRRCLVKEPERRWQSVADLAGELQWIAEGGSHAGVTPPAVSHRKSRESLPWVVVALLTIVSTLAFWRLWQSGPKPAEPMTFSADLGTDARLYTGFGASTILSSDGTRLAFVATGPDEKRRAYVRSLDQLQATPLSGTENASDLFFSPDGQWLGFFAERRLKKVSVQGGASVSICDAPLDFGASWAENDTIVFSDNLRTPLSQVSSAGGKAQPLLTLDQQAQEVTQRWPQLLPGDRAVLFTSDTHNGDYEDADIVVYSITSGQRKVLQHGGFFGRYVRTGHLLFMHQGTLFAVPFDLKNLKVTGQPSPILEEIAATPFDGHAQFSVSDRGDLVYITGHGGFQAVSLYWMDRENKFTPLRSAPSVYRYPAFSPDGKRLALQIYDGKREDIWVYEWERDTLTRLTFGSGEDYDAPIWTPDGQRITYSGVDHQGVGGVDIYWKRADGSGDAQRLTETKKPKFPDSWNPDGRTLVFDQVKPGSPDSWDILTMTMEGSEKLGWKPEEPKPLLSGPFSQDLAALSPDGRWLAYTSSESGSYEVYVRPFPGPGGKWQISTGGASLPKWSRIRKELFFRNQNNRIMVAAYSESGGSFRPEKPQFWSPGQFTDLGGSINDFDLHPDGKRLVVLKAPPTSEVQPSNRMTFVFDFFDELRRKAPSRN